MTKQLYEEVLADAKQLRQVAEDNAKRSLIEAVAPRIRQLIENELLNKESTDELDQAVPAAPRAPDKPGKLVTDDVADIDDESELGVEPVPGIGDAEVTADAISMPDAEGKVTLDLDALNVADATTGVPVDAPMFGTVDDEYELNTESVIALAPLSNNPVGRVESILYRLGEDVNNFKHASRIVKESKGFFDQIAKMISRVENTYDYVQESIADKSKKAAFEAKLESYYVELSKLQEQKMSKRSLKKMMSEGDVTLKLTGLPDDIDLSSVGVDLITGEEDEESASAPEGEESEGGEGEGDVDLGDLDLGGDESSDEDDTEEESKGSQMESRRRISDNTVVEIDEGMLRREIMRMKRARKINEDAVPTTKGHGASKTLDNFGGGKNDGDPWLDGDVTTESDQMDDDDQLDESDGIDGTLTMDEQQDQDQDQLDEQDDDQDQLDEQDDDDLDQAQDSREMGGDVAPSSMGPGAKTNKQSRQPGATVESIRRRLGFEKRLREATRKRAVRLQSEMKRAVARHDVKATKRLRTECALAKKRLVESTRRTNRFTQTLSEATSRNGVRHNGNPSRSAGSLTEAAKLREKLTETNLFNAKLVYTNKLLQNEALSRKQKAEIIERLDEANSIREIKLVYESLSQTLAGTSRPLAENTSRRVIGSSSAPTRPTSTQTLNEGCETERWAQLAGIK